MFASDKHASLLQQQKNVYGIDYRSAENETILADFETMRSEEQVPIL